MSKQNVLFVCIHNSARSQMAEEILRLYGGNKFDVESAGIEPGTLNPVVIEVLKEMSIDISNKKTQSVAHCLSKNKRYDFVITVCDETNAERCPVFPGSGQRLHWGFPDPSQFKGDWNERINQTRIIRDEIAQKVKDWLKI